MITRGGFPEGCFQTLLVSSSAVERILRDPRVVAATLTGSEPAGQSVAAICGDEIKPTVLELGGSDPFIVMPSADLDEAVKTAVTGRVQNNGQSCIAAKRFIVHTDIYDAFVDKFVERMEALKVGDPTDPDTDVGPLATESGRDEIAQAGRRRRRGRARRSVAAAQPLDRPGWFYPPTVVTDITKDMALYTEEVFGPVASMYRAAGIDEAIEIANATTFGLGSNAWTNDEAEQAALHRRHRGRPGLHQRDDGVLPGAGVRRRQAVGLRSRARGPWDPRVLQRQDRLGRLDPARADAKSPDTPSVRAMLRLLGVRPQLR